MGGYLLHAVSLSFALPSGDMRVKVRSLPEWA
jgi:hypothetical protein